MEFSQDTADRAPPAGPARPPAPARSPDVTLMIMQGSLGYLLGGLGACLVLLSRDLSVPRDQLSWLSAGFGAGLLALGVAGARLLRLGAARVLGLSAGAIALGALLLGAGHSIPLAQVGALFMGLGGAALVLVCPVILTGPASAARLTRVNAAASLCGIGAPLLVSAVDALTGKGRLALLLPVPALLWLIFRRAARSAPPPAAAASAARDPAPLAAPGAPSVPQVARRWLGIVAAVSPEFFFVVWGAARLQDSGLSPAAAAAAAAAFPIGLGVGRVIAPALMRKIPVVTVGAALASASALLAAAPVGPVLATLALLGAGLGIAALYPVALDRLMRTPGLGLLHGAALGSAASGTAVLGAPVLLAFLAGWASLRAGLIAAVPLLLLAWLLQRQGSGPGATPARAAVPDQVRG